MLIRFIPLMTRKQMMLEEILNEFDKVIKSPLNSTKTGMAESPITDVNNDRSINTSKKAPSFVKCNFSGFKTYTIIPKTRNLIIDGEVYEIEPYFNIKNAMNGDYKTLDYIFYHKGFDINDFQIQKETNMN